MNAAPSTSEPTPPNQATALAAGMALILRGLCALIAARFRLPKVAPHTCALCSCLNRLAQRFTRLMDRLAQGPLPPPRKRAPRPETPRPETPRPQAPRPRHRLPTGTLWLIRAIPNEAACYASQINHLLAQPGMADLIAATPRAARLLRPLVRLLGIDMPGAPARPEPAPKKPRAPRPKPASSPIRWSYTPGVHPPLKNPA